MPNQFTALKKRDAFVVIGPSIAYVPLTQGLFALIDVADISKLQMRNWYAKRFRCGMYAASNEGKRTVLMHREILNNPESSVDHVNGETLNNLRSNIRVATQAQQCINRKSWSNTGITGVHCKRNGTFSAYINVEGKRVHLGTFNRIEDACSIRTDSAIENHKDFRRNA